MGLYYKKQRIAGINFLPRLTLAEYTNLQIKPKYWIRTDTPTGYLRLNATDVSYDNTKNVKQAIDDADLREGGTINGNVVINYPSPTTSTFDTTLTLGNNIPTGTVGSSRGVIRAYDKTAYSGTILMGDSSLTADRYYIFPDKTGTVALDNTSASIVYNSVDNKMETFTLDPNYHTYLVSYYAGGGTRMLTWISCRTSTDYAIVDIIGTNNITWNNATITWGTTNYHTTSIVRIS